MLGGSEPTSCRLIRYLWDEGASLLFLHIVHVTKPCQWSSTAEWQFCNRKYVWLRKHAYPLFIVRNLLIAHYRSKWSSLLLSIILLPPLRNTDLHVTRITDGGERIILTDITTNAGLFGSSSRHPGRRIQFGDEDLLSVIVNLERYACQTIAWKSITDRPMVSRQTAFVMLEFLRTTYNRRHTDGSHELLWFSLDNCNVGVRN